MKIYIVELVTGEYDSVGYQTLFATDFEYKAKWYCSKGNEILAKYKDHYEQLEAEYDPDIESSYERWDIKQNRQLFTGGTFIYGETNYRTDFKI